MLNIFTEEKNKGSLMGVSAINTIFQDVRQQNKTQASNMKCQNLWGDEFLTIMEILTFKLRSSYFEITLLKIGSE